METVGHILTHVSGQLSDQRQGKQFTRWTRADLAEYLNEALREIGAYRPEAFAVTDTYALSPGSLQQLPQNAVLEAIVANPDGSPAVKSDDKLMKAFGAYARCIPKVRFVNGRPSYSVKSYAVDSDNNRLFYVSPPVPAGIAVSVKATVNTLENKYTLADWDAPVTIQDKFYNNIIDYMMARAYQKDTESQVSQRQAQTLLNLFYQIMGAKYKIDAARNSGYYNGEVGSGDSRSIVR